MRKRFRPKNGDAVLLAATAGVRQFLDIGTGLPTADNTHDVAQRVAPESRVVYVDHDPVVINHGRALLTAVSRLLDLELDLSPFEAAVRAFRTQCDQAVAQDAAVQAYVRQLEQDYDAPGTEAPHPRREEDFNPEQLMHELEDFLRQQREGRDD